MINGGTMTTLNDHIAAIQAALAAGPTQGPWVIGEFYQDEWYWTAANLKGANGQTIGTVAYGEGEGEQDAAYIAAANPEAVAAIIAAYEQVEAERDAYRAEALEIADVLATTQAAVAAQAAMTEQMRAALDEMSTPWNGIDNSCPYCGAYPKEQHAADCKIGRALALTPTAAEQQVTALREAAEAMLEAADGLRGAATERTYEEYEDAMHALRNAIKGRPGDA